MPPLPPAGIHARMFAYLNSYHPDPVYAWQVVKEMGLSASMGRRYLQRLAARGLVTLLPPEDLEPGLPVRRKYYGLTPAGRIFADLHLINDFTYTSGSGTRLMVTRSVVEVLGLLSRMSGTRIELARYTPMPQRQLNRVLVRLRNHGIAASRRQNGEGSSLVWSLTPQARALTDQCLHPGLPRQAFPH